MIISRVPKGYLQKSICGFYTLLWKENNKIRIDGYFLDIYKYYKYNLNNKPETFSLKSAKEQWCPSSPYKDVHETHSYVTLQWLKKFYIAMDFTLPIRDSNEKSLCLC